MGAYHAQISFEVKEDLIPPDGPQLSHVSREQ